MNLEPWRRLAAKFDAPSRRHVDRPSLFDVREVHADEERALFSRLDACAAPTLVVAGQQGSGKTTLLLSLAAALRGAGRFVVYVDLSPLRGPYAVAVAGVAVLGTVLAQANDACCLLGNGILQHCAAGLAAVFGTAVPADPGSLARHFEWCCNLLRDRPTLRGAFFAQIAPWRIVTDLLRALVAKRRLERPVLLLDGIDKLSSGVGPQDVLWDEVRASLADVSCAAVLAAPPSALWAPGAADAVLCALPWSTPHGNALLRRVVSERVAAACVDPGLVGADALDLVLEGSGGNLAALVRLLVASIVKAVAQEAAEVARSHVEEALEDQCATYGRLLETRFLPELRAVRDHHALDPTTPVAAHLLACLWILEYRSGDRVWHDLPLAVRRLLALREPSVRDVP